MAQKPLDTKIESVFVGIKMLETMAESLDDLAAKRDSNRSALIREAISAYLASRTSVEPPLATAG